MGKAMKLMTPHDEYKALGKTPEACQQAYRGLFRGRLAKKDLVEIRDSVNRGWVLGGDRFKQQIEKKTGRQASPARGGGDGKSEKYRESKYQ